jgi:hypothetical protein
MSKAKCKRQIERQNTKAKVHLTATTARRTKKRLSKGKPQRPQIQRSGRADSKQAQILALLRSLAGTTIGAMAKATGWQQHSVRGFLSGTVRKKLGLNLVSEPGDTGLVYRIRDGRSSSALQA